MSREPLSSKEQLIPLPDSVWLVCHLGNSPYLGKLYEDRETALRTKQSYEVVVEIRVAHEEDLTFSERMTDLIRRDHAAEGQGMLDRAHLTAENEELEDRYCKEGLVKNEIIARYGAVLREIASGRFADESCIRKAREALGDPL